MLTGILQHHRECIVDKTCLCSTEHTISEKKKLTQQLSLPVLPSKSQKNSDGRKKPSSHTVLWVIKMFLANFVLCPRFQRATCPPKVPFHESLRGCGNALQGGISTRPESVSTNHHHSSTVSRCGTRTVTASVHTFARENVCALHSFLHRRHRILHEHEHPRRHFDVAHSFPKVVFHLGESVRSQEFDPKPTLVSPFVFRQVLAV